jgi:hypothetical protein
MIDCKANVGAFNGRVLDTLFVGCVEQKSVDSHPDQHKGVHGTFIDEKILPPQRLHQSAHIPASESTSR